MNRENKTLDTLKKQSKLHNDLKQQLEDQKMYIKNLEQSLENKKDLDDEIYKLKEQHELLKVE